MHNSPPPPDIDVNDFISIEDLNFDSYYTNSQFVEAAKRSRKYNNKRKSIRYIRKDITVFISQPDIFGGYSLFSSSRPIMVKLFDISSRGMLISGPARLVLKKNKKLMLTLVFNSNRIFEISAVVTREIVGQRRFYGLKFDKVNDELGDYLLETQDDLIFS